MFSAKWEKLGGLARFHKADQTGRGAAASKKDYQDEFTLKESTARSITKLI